MKAKILAIAACMLLSSCNTVSYDFSDVKVAPQRFSETDPAEDFTGRKPETYPVHGTDVSKYQRDVDWQTAKANGVSFAFIKATEGGDRVDDYFARNYAATRAAGIPRAAYHFFYFCTPAAVQARWFIRNVPRDASALPHLLDMEWNHKSPSCKLRPDPETVRSEMKIWLSIVERHYGKRPLIYVTPDFYDENLKGHFDSHQYFLRSVADHPANRYPGQKWTFWQYSGTGRIPGVAGDADMNVFAGSPSAFKAWVNGK
jgi:lysozyme